MNEIDHFYLEVIAENHLGSHLKRVSAVSGGCINNAVALETEQGSFFLKWRRNAGDLFIKEANGLVILRDKSPIRTPEIICVSQIEDKNYLLMPFEVSASPSPGFWMEFGEMLAEQHRQSQSLFGLNEDNYIGLLPQSNSYEKSWTDFYVNKRLTPQVSVAHKKGLLSTTDISSFEKLYQHLPHIFPEEPPALLHGDLWSGNLMIGSDGNALILDPAVYYGHREMELAFTRMFGGFDGEFYEAYEASYPLEAGFEQRMAIYHLYPLLVHANLFGGGYVSQIRQVIQSFDD